MSTAYICDKCGRIIPSDGGEIRGIWTINPALFSEHHNPTLHLCSECFEKFEREYMENKNNYGCEVEE